MSESVRTRGLPYLTEPEQFVAREVCIGLGPSPRATRSSHGEHSVPRMNPRLDYASIVSMLANCVNFLGKNVDSKGQTRGREYNFDKKLIVLYN